jgi:hypothetical protein
LQVKVEHSDLGGSAMLSQTGKDVEIELSQHCGPAGPATLTLLIKGKPVSGAQSGHSKAAVAQRAG